MKIPLIHRRGFWTLQLVLLLAGRMPANAQDKLQSHSVNAGAQITSSSNFNLRASVGQTLSGSSSSASFKLNVGFLAGANVTRKPDLEFTEANISPNPIAPGGQLSISFDIRNSGDSIAAGNVKVDAYLSSNGTFESGDTKLGTFSPVTSDMAEGAIYEFPVGDQSNKLPIPQGTATGSYFVILVADPDNTVTEQLEDNNTIAKAISIEVGVGADNGKPSITNVSSGVFKVGASITANVTDNSSGVKEVYLHYRPITDAEYDSVAMTVSGSAYSVSMTAAMADLLGLEGFVSASDYAGNYSVETAHHYWYQPNSPDAAIPFTSDFDGTKATYEMFSIPYNLTDRNLEVVFDEMGGYDKDVWRIFRYLGGKYVELGSGLTNIDPGRGFWFNAKKQPGEIKIGTGSVVQVSQDDPFEMTFEKGWNQIGNPYPFSVSWAEVQSANPDAGLNSLFIFKDRDYAKTETLEPWRGAFVFCDNGGIVKFPLESGSSGRVKKSIEWHTIDDDAWRIELDLKLNDRSAVGAVGMHSQANESKDKFDEIVVPRFVSWLEMGTQHTEFPWGNFSEDIVPDADIYKWEFLLHSNEMSDRGSITWDNADLANANAGIYLVDQTLLQVVDMKLNNSYEFPWRDGKKIQILYSKTGEVNPSLSGMGTPYPNPFSTTVTIPVWTASENEPIQVEIFDMVGRRIQSMNTYSSKQGLQDVVWHGNDDLGNSAPGGAYFIKFGSEVKRIIKQ